MDFQSHFSTGLHKPPAELKAPMAQMYERGQQFLLARMLVDVEREEYSNGRVTKPETRRTRIMKAKRKNTHTFSDEQKERARQALGLPFAGNHKTLENASGLRHPASSIYSPTQSPLIAPPTPRSNTFADTGLAVQSTEHIQQTYHESFHDHIQAPGGHKQCSQASNKPIEKLPIQSSTPSSGHPPVVDPAAINNTIGLVDTATQGTMRLLQMENDSLQQDIQALDVYARREQGSDQPDYKLQQQLAEKQEWRKMLEVHTEYFFQKAQYYRSSLESAQRIPEVATQCCPIPSADGGDCEAATEDRMDVG